MFYIWRRDRHSWLTYPLLANTIMYPSERLQAAVFTGVTHMPPVAVTAP